MLASLFFFVRLVSYKEIQKTTTKFNELLPQKKERYFLQIKLYIFFFSVNSLRKKYSCILHFKNIINIYISYTIHFEHNSKLTNLYNQYMFCNSFKPSLHSDNNSLYIIIKLSYSMQKDQTF